MRSRHLHRTITDWFAVAPPMILILAAAVGCGPTGVQRSDLARWEPIRLPHIGVQLEVPTDCYFRDLDSPSTAAFHLHPVYPPNNVMDEPRCILEVQLFKKTKLQFDEDLHWVALRNEDEETHRVSTWLYSIHPKADRMERASQYLYRLDVQCQDGSIAKVTASLVRVAGNDADEFVAADDVAIRRILSSVECLEK